MKDSLSQFRYRYLYHPLWFLGEWIQRHKWKTGTRWLETEYTGTACKHFSWALGHLNQLRFTESMKCLRFVISDLKTVLWHRRRRLSGNALSNNEFYKPTVRA